MFIKPARRDCPIERFFTRFASHMANKAGRPSAFALSVSLIVLWIVTGPVFGWSDTWQLVVNTATTIVTFLMVFLIQNSQNRDAAALQAKLDEVIRSLRKARNEFIGIEHLTDTQIEGIRARLEREVEQSGDGRRSSQAVARMLRRRKGIAAGSVPGGGLAR